jgi:hypothetical protein
MFGAHEFPLYLLNAGIIHRLTEFPIFKGEETNEEVKIMKNIKQVI